MTMIDEKKSDLLRPIIQILSNFARENDLDFALCIVDKNSDPIGEKGCYYAHIDGPTERSISMIDFLKKLVDGNKAFWDEKKKLES